MAMPEQGQPMPEAAPEGGGAAAPGGASKLVADVHSGMMKLMDMMAGKMPEEEQKLGAIVQAFQGFVDGLGQAPGASQGPAQPGTTTPEAGAASVKPAM
jgi:hypothetical protein